MSKREREKGHFPTSDVIRPVNPKLNPQTPNTSFLDLLGRPRNSTQSSPERLGLQS